MDNPKVTIIVPVYNVEYYIEHCIQSIIDQDYENIEIIFVIDGSPDGSIDIINRAAEKDKRIIVIEQKNQGVSAARNTGLKSATGVWVTFIDGDDWVERDYVSYLLKTAQKYNCEISMGRRFYSIDGAVSEESEYKISSVETQKRIYNDDIFVAVWNKMYKTELLRKHDIQFNEDIWYGEGMLFNIQCLQCVNKVAIGEKSVYHQTFNPNSAMRSFNLKSNYCGLKSMDIQREFLHDKSLIKEWRYHRYKFNRSIIDGLIRSKQDDEYRKDLDNCIHDLRTKLWIPLTTEKSIKKNLIWILYSIFPRIMARISADHFMQRVRKVGGVLLKSIFPEASLPIPAIGGAC